MKFIASFIVALLATLALAASVSAAPSNATITLDQANPSVGDTITFTVTGVENSENPAVRVTCWASRRTHVYEVTNRDEDPFTLNFMSNGEPFFGSASCTADLFVEFGDWNRVARVRFSVAP